ncbi:MAG: TraB/GumN family protein [Proteobacteria bacterium]|nr:TraB/GumN family protein [Pseudomonadota bacterium]
MRSLYIFLTIISIQSFSTEAQDFNQSDYPIEEVIAYGIRPGPELWKVSSGENVLWILGTLSPLPKKMRWQSSLVEAVIEDSQALLLPPSISFKFGFFQGLSLAKNAIGIKKNPEKKKLIDIVPKNDYVRWLLLKKKYLGRDRGVEKVRPIFAADKLFEHAIKQIGLTRDTKVVKKIRKLAKKNKLVNIKPTIALDIKEPKSALKKFKKTQISDLECFRKTLDRLEGDLSTMRLRAIAWANGDVSKIKEITFPNQNQSCASAILDNNIAKDMDMADIRQRLRHVWLDSAKKALLENRSTFAILPMHTLLAENSVLLELEEAGYTVDVPK